MTTTRGRFAVHPVPGPDAEDVLVLTDGPHEGSVLTGTADGVIWRLAHDGARLDQVAHTGGRPLGLERHPDGRVVVCDVERGLLVLDHGTGALETLVPAGTDVDGTPLRVCNNAAVTADGTIFFSDSSSRYDLPHWKRDFVEATRSGRLLRRDPDGGVQVVTTGLAFANGVALVGDASAVLVAETGGRTIVRVHLAGPRAGERDLFASGLPGYPDNLSRGSDGLVWAALASPTDPLVERLQRAPVPLRRLAARLPEALQPSIAQTVRVQAFADDGRLVHDLDVDAAAHGADYHAVTGVREHEGRVWMASFVEPAVAVLDDGLDDGLDDALDDAR